MATASRHDHVSAELARARSEYRALARMEERLTRAEYAQKVAALTRVRELERELARLSKASSSRDSSRSPSHTWRLVGSRWRHPSFGLVAKRADGWYGFAPGGLKVGPFSSAKDARNALGHAVTKRGGYASRSSRDPGRVIYISRSQNVVGLIDNAYGHLTSKEASRFMRAIDDAEREGEDTWRAAVGYLREIGITVHVREPSRDRARRRTTARTKR